MSKRTIFLNTLSILLIGFDEYLKCGRLEHGFLRVQCESCQAEHLVAFSCKRRGFCPSCGARRMVESAALLVDEVLPQQPMRQWVLSVPVCGELIISHYRPVSALCENRVTRLCTVVIGTAFATDTLRPTVNQIKYLQVEFRFRETGAAFVTNYVVSSAAMHISPDCCGQFVYTIIPDNRCDRSLYTRAAASPRSGHSVDSKNVDATGR